MYARYILFLLFVVYLAPAAAQEKRAYRPPEFAAGWERATEHPDHIVLNLTADPSTSMSVTWRTNPYVRRGYAEIAPATAAPKFWRNAVTVRAGTQVLDFSDIVEAETVNAYHTVTFEDLEPNTLYGYRVGDGQIWSEWIQFRTAAAGEAPFSFLYVGDAQNYILELWSRLIREGYRTAPDADFIIHAGDLVNTANNERQWHEWFTAGGFIHSMLPSLPTPGNHEHRARNRREAEAGERHLSVQWRPQFNLPLNGPKGMDTLAETVYYVDYQNTRVISLNSNKFQEEQVAWLDGVLSDNPNKWTVLTFHHPLYSASERRNNDELRELWKPVFDKHRVDIVLQGHDHSYARGRTGVPEENVVEGMNLRDYTGTVYVVSVSGGKMYNLRPNAWDDFPEAERDRGAENTQLFQVVSVAGDTLRFAAYTATGELYDAFDLIKEGEGPNRFVERKQEGGPVLLHDNTISYQDELPLDLRDKLARVYPGFELSRVDYIDDAEFHGYVLRYYKDREELNLRVDHRGEVLEETREVD